MSHQMTLDSLHSSLSLETAKLVRWEVETVVNMRDREGQIQQTAGVTATQEQMIPQLEEENLRLRGELSGVKHEREELGQRISYTRREVEVLGSQFMELQGELEKLRGCPVVINTGKEMEELTVSVRELRLKAATSRKEAKRTMEELEITRRCEEERESLSKKGMTEKIEEAKKEVERRLNSVSALKNKFNEVSAEVLAKKEDLDRSASRLAEVKAKQAGEVELNSKMEAELGEEVISLASRVEKMDRENVNMKEKLKNEMTKNQEQEDQLNRLDREMEKKISEKSNKEAVSNKKKDECHMLDEQVKIVMVEVDRLSKLVEEEEKVEKDLEMLRADLRVCEENRKMIENEVVVMKRVEQQKVGLEKENVNMKSRADLLREKEESYNEDLAFCKNQMDEMAEKEEQLMIQLKGLEEEDSDLEKEMAALESAASHATEEAKMTEAGNKELEENIHELMEKSKSIKDALKDLESEETSVQKNLTSLRTETEQLIAAVANAEEENKFKVKACEVNKEEEKKVASKLSLVEIGLKKKQETRQLLQKTLDSIMGEEGKLKSLMDSKRNTFSELVKKKKAADDKNLIIEEENEALDNEKVKLLDTMAALEAELQVKRSHLVGGMDSLVATEMEITRKKYEESAAELELVKKDVLEMVASEEEVMKQLEAIELEIKSKKSAFIEKTKLEEKLGKEVMNADKECKAVEKNMKSKFKDIEAEESRLMNEKQAIEILNNELIKSEENRLEMESELDLLKKKKAADLELFRANVDKKAIDSNEALKEMEGKKEELKKTIKETERQVEKLDLLKKTDEAKKKLEKVEKSKEFKVKKETMMEEMTRLKFLLSESKKEFEAQSNLARSLQADIKKLNTAVEVDMVEVDSDEENITTRKVMSRSPSTTPRNRSFLSLPTSTTTKRKLEDMSSSTVKSGLDNIYQFGDSSDSEGQSQPKFQVPSTPRGRNIFSSRSSKQVPFTPKGKPQQQQKPVPVGETLSQPGPPPSTSPAPSPLRTFALPLSRPAKPHNKGEKVKIKKTKEASPLVSFDEVMAVSSDVDSN